MSKPGRPEGTTKVEGWTRCIFGLEASQREYLGRAGNALQVEGTKGPRPVGQSGIVRALLRALEASRLDVSKFTTEDELADELTRRLRRR